MSSHITLAVGSTLRLMAPRSPQPLAPVPLSEEERTLLRDALRVPRGQYNAERAAQLSGVPSRTVYHWAKTGSLVPDYDDSPKAWSYRDLVFLRLTAWLRTRNVPLPLTVSLVSGWREEFEAAKGPDVTTISSDGVGLGVGTGFEVDVLSGQSVFTTMVHNVETFDLLAPLDVAGLGRGRLWGPNLVRPSRSTSMSPWIMRGEPCLTGSRIATGPLYALATTRRLSVDQIARLYPGVSGPDVEDALALEDKLRNAA